MRLVEKQSFFPDEIVAETEVLVYHMKVVGRTRLQFAGDGVWVARVIGFEILAAFAGGLWGGRPFATGFINEHGEGDFSFVHELDGDLHRFLPHHNDLPHLAGEEPECSRRAGLAVWDVEVPVAVRVDGGCGRHRPDTDQRERGDERQGRLGCLVHVLVLLASIGQSQAKVNPQKTSIMA
jgi:hypothetical protein